MTPRSSTHRPRVSGIYRYLTAATAVVVAASHVPITEDHFHEAPYVGALFVLLELAALGVAAVLLWRETALAYLFAALTGGLAIAAYVLSRSVGLPQISDDVGDWANPLGIVALSAEALLVVLALAGWRSLGRPEPFRVPRAVAVLPAGALLVLGTSATAVAAREDGMSAADMPARSAMPMSADWQAARGAVSPAGGTTRTYYLQAEDVAWNYAPTGRNAVTGKPFDAVASLYTKAGPNRIGSTYRKCLYEGYGDAAFHHRLARPADEAYLGLLGPTVHAAVGDTIRIVFRNRCPFPTSVHPHGVFYDKNSEGAPYADGTGAADKADDAVPTGGSHTYTWRVPERAGPGPGDGSSVMWMYHSHTDEIADTNAGLIGPMIVTKRGMARPDGTPKDVDREVVALFSIFNENLSPLLRESLNRYAEPPRNPSPPDEDFAESNLKHAVNGYLYGNMPALGMHKGERVRWYVMSMGTETDLHTPHWHGNTVLVNGMRMDVVSLLPASMVVADMVPDNVGIWFFHCHVNDHIRAGMLARYQVLP